MILERDWAKKRSVLVRTMHARLKKMRACWAESSSYLLESVESGGACVGRCSWGDVANPVGEEIP